MSAEGYDPEADEEGGDVKVSSFMIYKMLYLIVQLI